MPKNKYEVKIKHSPKGKKIWSVATLGPISADSETNAQIEARKHYPANMYDSEIVSVKQK